jgi:hypothetical protein
MCPVGRDLIENGFVAARVGKLAAKARLGLFEVNADLETTFHLTDPIASKFLGARRGYNPTRR